MDGGAWWATVYGVTKSRTRLRDFTILDNGIPPTYTPPLSVFFNGAVCLWVSLVTTRQTGF